MIPAVAPDAADAAWFTAVLRDAGVLPSGEVVSVESEAIGHGLLCESVRFALTYSEPTDAPAAVVGKFSSQHPGMRAGAIAEQTYQREFAFYQDLVHGLRVPTARCLACVGDPAVEFVLVMEDLAPTASVDQMAGCGLDQAEAVMDAAVGLHAPRWGDPALDEAYWSVRGSWIPRVAVGYPKSFGRFAERFDVDVDVTGIGEAFAPVLQQWFDGQPRPWTVTHGDFRGDNMLFGIRGGTEPVGVLDWQTMMPSSATVDVAYFLGSSVDAADRRKHEEHLVRRYHAGLVDAGVENYSFDRCFEDYRYNAFLGYLMCTYSAALVRGTPRSDAMFSTWARRASAQIRDLDCLSLLPKGNEC